MERRPARAVESELTRRRAVPLAPVYRHPCGCRVTDGFSLCPHFPTDEAIHARALQGEFWESENAARWDEWVAREAVKACEAAKEAAVEGEDPPPRPPKRVA